jgi:hypothetical protein
MSFIEYTNCQYENTQRLIVASKILCTLAKNSNIYFLFSFNIESNGESLISSQMLEDNLKIDSSLLEKMIEAMIFHENKELSYNFCLLSTTLLVLHSKSSESPDKKKVEFIKHLFNLTKNGLFAIILECDKSIQQLNESEKDYDEKLKNYTKYLKVSVIGLFYLTVT